MGSGLSACEPEASARAASPPPEVSPDAHRSAEVQPRGGHCPEVRTAAEVGFHIDCAQKAVRAEALYFHVFGVGRACQSLVLASIHLSCSTS